MEQEAIAREQAIEEKVQNRLKQQNERFEAQEEYNRQEAEDRYAQRLREERDRIQRDFEEQRSRLQLQTTQERAHDQQMVDMAKRDKAAAEDRASMESERANRAEDEIKMLREQLLEANRAKDNYYSRAC